MGLYIQMFFGVHVGELSPRHPSDTDVDPQWIHVLDHPTPNCHYVCSVDDRVNLYVGLIVEGSGCGAVFSPDIHEFTSDQWNERFTQVLLELPEHLRNTLPTLNPAFHVVAYEA